MLLRHLALASSLALAAAPAIAYAAPSTPALVETVKAAAPQSSTTDASSYAEREARDSKVASFQGGDLVVIGVSGGAILVLLFLLLILA
jgi:hypothetical protein